MALIPGLPPRQGDGEQRLLQRGKSVFSPRTTSGDSAEKEGRETSPRHCTFACQCPCTPGETCRCHPSCCHETGRGRTSQGPAQPRGMPATLHLPPAPRIRSRAQHTGQAQDRRAGELHQRQPESQSSQLHPPRAALSPTQLPGFSPVELVLFPFCRGPRLDRDPGWLSAWGPWLRAEQETAAQSPIAPAAWKAIQISPWGGDGACITATGACLEGRSIPPHTQLSESPLCY